MTRRTCPSCGTSVAVSPNGIFRPHGWTTEQPPCPGSRTQWVDPEGDRPKPTRCGDCGQLRIAHRNGGPIPGTCPRGFQKPKGNKERPAWMRANQ